jgi:hypothetical protein
MTTGKITEPNTFNQLRTEKKTRQVAPKQSTTSSAEKEAARSSADKRIRDMELPKVTKLGQRLLKLHGLKGWMFDADLNSATLEAVCDYTKKHISINLLLLIKKFRTDDDIRSVILHEIAHALVGYAHGHDEVWEEKAVAIGSKKNTAYPGNTWPEYDSKWEELHP